MSCITGMGRWYKYTGPTISNSDFCKKKPNRSLLDPVMLIKYKTVTWSGSKMDVVCFVMWLEILRVMWQNKPHNMTDSVRESKACPLQSRLGPGSWTVSKQILPRCFSWISITCFIYFALSWVWFSQIPNYLDNGVQQSSHFSQIWKYLNHSYWQTLIFRWKLEGRKLIDNNVKNQCQ